ncbi:hypothetical protein GUITHDRAFT_116759 [Guillardia theta CCMP2712]|uniref:Uncharacterized protein n=1 Tax=Guillardia theta (strain CCMP2712) TaxID=905079 RepID=L1IL97_GUITC|nr:hypothetical protein GUITHDRAFT_116759 [Guillardia theta CCMP2712]EKX37033.1 hypothetical protein GUITHDRAFT_116759 [Guillardia theta CCMP2712]|eukprot:XP_005824013.1 hypothetical protein GUITHDRAFT_116759 [Guillardia theta CCMP2712]
MMMMMMMSDDDDDDDADDDADDDDDDADADDGVVDDDDDDDDDDGDDEDDNDDGDDDDDDVDEEEDDDDDDDDDNDDDGDDGDDDDNDGDGGDDDDDGYFQVDAFVSWSHYSLIPENKVVNLVERIDMLAKEITYQSSSTDIVHELNANSMEMCERRTQFVIYQGKRGLGLRSIYTARTIANLFDHCVVLVKKYHYILNDQRPASADTNLMVLQKAVLRLVDRLYSSRFLHAWAWLVACNNPPGYLEIMDVQETLQRVANSLQIADDENVHYALYSCFKPEAEITGSQLRLHVQSLNLPIPPRYKTTMMDYYDKALCKVNTSRARSESGGSKVGGVKGEPTTEVTIRSRMQQTSIMSSDDVDVSEAFEGSMLLEDVGF